MKIKDIMTATSLKYCNPETKLHNAARAMKSGNCGALPVVDKNKKVVGIITDRDIALSMAKKHPLPASQLSVEKIMSKKIHSVYPEDDISSALHEMRTYQVGRLPVVDRQGKLKGIVSLHNLLSGSLKKENGEFENLSSNGENINKTIKALTDRYSPRQEKKTKLRTAL